MRLLTSGAAVPIEFRGRRCVVALRDGNHVSGRARMAMLASDARLERIEGDPALIRTTRAVTIKADDVFRRSRAPWFPPDCGDATLVARSDGQAAQFQVMQSLTMLS